MSRRRDPLLQPGVNPRFVRFYRRSQEFTSSLAFSAGIVGPAIAMFGAPSIGRMLGDCQAATSCGFGVTVGLGALTGVAWFLVGQTRGGAMRFVVAFLGSAASLGFAEAFTYRGNFGMAFGGAVASTASITLELGLLGVPVFALLHLARRMRSGPRA